MWEDVKPLSLSHSEQEDAEGVCGGPLDISGTPEIVDRLSQGTFVTERRSIFAVDVQRFVLQIDPTDSGFIDRSAVFRLSLLLFCGVSVLRRHRRLLAADGSSPTRAATSSPSRRTRQPDSRRRRG